jgi:DNA-binding CsgD family transcriptional regulator
MSAFVGRREELAELRDIIGAAAAGHVAAAVVVGEPGSGKSRLLAEAAVQAPLSNRFRVVGYELERDVPLAAASDLLLELAALAPRVHGLERLLFADDREGAGALRPLRIFESAHRALRTIGQALVLIDDVQWVDDLSLALCHYLVRAARDHGESVALIAGGRTSPASNSLVVSLGQVLTSERVRLLELGSLSSGEALELVGMLEPGLAPAAARELVARSGGSPFWLEALVRTAGAEVDAGRLVTARLRGASGDAGGLLALLAVAGRPLVLGDAAELNGWDVSRVELAVRELVSRGVAVDSGGMLRLAHDLIRVAAAGELPEEQRLDVHRRVGEWLMQRAGTDVRRLREALGHMHAAGLPCAGLADRLVRSPQRTLLGEDGLALLVRIADESGPSALSVLLLNEEIAGLASELARHDVALERNLLLAERWPDSVRRGRALLDAARSAFALDDPVRAGSYLDRARESHAGDELLDLELDVQQAALDLWGAGPKEKERGRALAHDTVQRGRRLDDSDERARRAFLEALRVEYEAAFQEDDLSAMAGAAEERAAVAREFDEQAHLTALIASARALQRAGRLDDALERARYVWNEAGRRVLPRLTLDAGYWLGAFLLQRGRMGDAEEIVGETLELASRVGDEARGRHPIERVASEVDFHRGDWRVGVERLLAHARGASEHARIELHQLAAIWLALVGGQEFTQEVVAQVDAARACAEVAACPRCATELRLAAAYALARVGQCAEAAHSLEEWERVQPHRHPRDELTCRRIQALLAEHDGAQLLEAALERAEELNFALDALWIRIDLGRILADTDRARAKEVLAVAAETAAEIGARTERQVAEKRLRGLGVRTWRRGPGSELLTERERQVARLIAGGASNPEIAQELFLSRKTVERHVSNLLKKVGVRNRAELAARASVLEVEGAPR